MKKKTVTFKDINPQTLIKQYNETNSSHKVALIYGVAPISVRRWLKRLNVLRTFEQALEKRDHSYLKGMKRSDESKERIRQSALNRKTQRVGYKHSEATKAKIAQKAKLRVGNKNSNYKHGQNVKRPRDYKLTEFKPILKQALKNANYTCAISGVSNDKLQVHHLIPYRVCPEAYLDLENLMVVTSEVHFNLCHKGNWNVFNVDLISDYLLQKYNLNRERLNELAVMWITNSQTDAIVRPTDISETVETNRNDLSFQK